MGVPRGPIHDIRLPLLIRQTNRRDHIRSQVNAENADSPQGERDPCQDEQKERGQLGDVIGERVEHTLLQVIEDQSSLLHTGDDGGKIVIQEDHVRRFFTHIRSRYPHRDPDVRLLQRWGVVDLSNQKKVLKWIRFGLEIPIVLVYPVSSHSHASILSLEPFHNLKLLLGRSPGENELVIVCNYRVQLILIHPDKL